MDSDGKPRSYAKTSNDDDGNLLRTVSFPNFLRGFWDHHHGTDSISHSAVNSNASSTSHIAESDTAIIAPGIKNINQPVMLPSAQAPANDIVDQKFSQSIQPAVPPTVDKNAAAFKLNRCDTWAGFNAPTVVENQATQNANVASQNPENVSKTLDALHLTSPSTPAATVPPSLPRIHDRVLPDSRPLHHNSSLLAALFHHELSRPTLPPQQSTIDGSSSTATATPLPHFAGVHGVHDQQHDRNAIHPMMGSEQHNELDFPGGLSRTVSFPNFFRGFLDFHQLEEGIEHLPLNFTSSSDVTSSGNANITSDGLISSSNNYIPESDNTSGWLLQHYGTKNNDITPVGKLLRSETWAGGFASVADDSRASDSTADINTKVDSASCDKNISRTSENSAVTPNADKFESSIRPVAVVGNQSQSHATDVSPVPASVNVLPSLHELTPTAGKHRSRILSALVTHDKSVAIGDTVTTSSSGKLWSPGIVQQQQQHQLPQLPVNNNVNAHSAERKGLFGMPNRVKVSPREINMMSPTSF